MLSYWTDDVKSFAIQLYWTITDIKMMSKVQPIAGCWTVDQENLGMGLSYMYTMFGEQKNKKQKDKTPLRKGKYFE